MSLQTWIEEFYPVPADDCEPGHELEHSLRKWIGLRPKNLQRHLVTASWGSLYYGTEQLVIGGSTCALCVRYYRSESSCKNCPLRIVHKGTCDQARGKQGISPYGSFVCNNDPEPMIRLIRKAMKK